MADEDLGAGFVTITLDDSNAVDAAEDLADRLARALDRGAREAGLRMERQITRAVRRISPVSIDVTADTSDFQFELLLITRKLPTVEIMVLPRVDPIRWRRIILAATAGIRIPIRVVPDTTGFDAALRAMRTPTIRVDVDPNLNARRITRALSGLSGILGSAAKATALSLAIGAVGIAAASATVSVLALGAALAPAVGIFAAGPAVILGFAAAMGALKLATAGVGDAFKAGLTGDAKAFEKAMKTLSPAAQKAAKEVRALKPAFDDLRKSVQDALFSRLTGEITKTAEALGGTLKTGLTGISAAFGEAARQALVFLQSTEAVSNIGTILGGTQTALSGLGQPIQDVLQGFLAIGASISKAFGSELASGLATLGERFGGFLTAAARSGEAISWVDNALNVFAQLGDIIANIGTILGAVFDSAESVSGGFLNNIRMVTDQIREFVESSRGVAALEGVFKGVSAVAANLGPILSSLVTLIGAVAPTLIPVFNALGSAIVAAVGAIGPALLALTPAIKIVAQALESAINVIAESGVLRSVADAFGDVLIAISPILPVAARLVSVLGAALTPVISALAPVLGAIVGVLSEVVTAITPLLVVAGQLVAQLGPVLTPIVVAVGKAVAQLAPLFATVANILSSVLAPILDVLPGLIQPLLDGFNELVAALLPPLNQLLIQLQPSLIQLSQAIVKVLIALIPVIVQITELSLKITNALMPLIQPLIGLIAELAAILSGTLAKYLTSIVIPALNAVAALLRGDFSAAFRSMKEVVRNEITLVKDLITDLPVKILAAVGRFDNLLFGAGQDLVRGMINGLKSMLGNLLSAAGDLASSAVNKIKGQLGIGSPSKVLRQIGAWTGEGFVNGIDSMVAAAGRAARDLAVSAISPMANAAFPSSGAAALRPFTQPFGPAGPQGFNAPRSTRQTAAQAVPSASSGPAVVNNFTINEVGDGTVTAQRIINRMVTSAGTYLL